MNMPIAGLLLTIAVIVLGIADLCFVVFTGAPSSISDFLIRAGFRAPLMVFAFGFTAGHLFAGMKLELYKATDEEFDEMAKERGYKKE